MSAPQQVAQLVEKAGLSTAIGFGAWVWLAENAQAIGAVCAMVGALVAVIGLAVSTYYKHKDSKGPRA